MAEHRLVHDFSDEVLETFKDDEREELPMMCGACGKKEADMKPGDECPVEGV